MPPNSSTIDIERFPLTKTDRNAVAFEPELGIPRITEGYSTDMAHLFTHVHHPHLNGSAPTHIETAEDTMRAHKEVDAHGAIIAAKHSVDIAAAPKIIERIRGVQDFIQTRVKKGVNKSQTPRAGMLLDKKEHEEMKLRSEKERFVIEKPRPLNQLINPERATSAFLRANESVTEVALQSFPEFAGIVKQSIKDLEANITNAFALFNEIMDAKKHPMIAYMTKADLDQALETCMHLASRSNYNVLMTVGYGGSDHETSTRVPGYVIPSIKLLETFKRYHVQGLIKSMPQLRILDASRTAVGINRNFDNDRMLQVANEREKAARLFVKHFANTTWKSDDGKTTIPLDLQGDITVENDEGISYCTIDEVKNHFSKVNLSDEQMQEIADMVERASGKIGENVSDVRDHVLQYIYVHRYVFLDLINAKRNPSKHRPDVTWSMGGGAEIPFNRYRRLFDGMTDNGEYEVDRVALIQNMGGHPPYYNTPFDVPLSAYNGESIIPRINVTDPKDKEAAKVVSHDMKLMHAFVAQRAAERGMTAEQAFLAYAEALRG